jgi:hypothetical protein
VAEKGKGDERDRVDHESLGRSLHQVGHCLSSLDRFGQAQPWFERAVAEKGKGDLKGRVDHHNLALSLRAAADCSRWQGNLNQAEAWSLEASRLDEQMN